MRTAAAAIVLALAGVVVSQPAEAHRRVHSHVSIGLGFGYWGPYWGAPWWYYPPAPVYYPVVVPAQPVTYIEQNPSQSAPASNDGGGWWYYCDASKGYYPYVKECPGGWQRVSPTPPSTK
jgi:hypothetical protein